MRFNEVKATQAAGRLLEHRGGRMSYMKLIKLLYLADSRGIESVGQTHYNGQVRLYEQGPRLEPGS